jgi:hypothetical protein
MFAQIDLAESSHDPPKYHLDLLGFGLC